ncbi:MAG: EF-P lysine aminoacylase GenX [Planctomycetes bacterium]|nr:EF-P lysine aminoacylase GenX [Planctomycetota bacterium]
MVSMNQKIFNLERRSELLSALRQFFLDRDFLEVETPLLSSEVIPEQHIEPVVVADKQFLQASPELHMKRLVAAGMKAIYQVTRSFRGHEQGRLHNPEFTIVEWYRTGDDMQAGIALLDELCQTLLETPPATRTSYGEAFEQHVGLCPHTSTSAELWERARALAINVPDAMPRDDCDEWLNLLLAIQVEPKLGAAGPEILYDYPASQAALAKLVQREDGKRVAARFELYWRGIELANGYDELADAAELRSRLEAVNRSRQADGKAILPLPESLLAAMKTGLPDCSGCALGFDRLVMLALNAESIAEVRA